MIIMLWEWECLYFFDRLVNAVDVLQQCFPLFGWKWDAFFGRSPIAVLFVELTNVHVRLASERSNRYPAIVAQLEHLITPFLRFLLCFFHWSALQTENIQNSECVFFYEKKIFSFIQPWIGRKKMDTYIVWTRIAVGWRCSSCCCLLFWHFETKTSTIFATATTSMFYKYFGVKHWKITRLNRFLCTKPIQRYCRSYECCCLLINAKKLKFRIASRSIETVVAFITGSTEYAQFYFVSWTNVIAFDVAIFSSDVHSNSPLRCFRCAQFWIRMRVTFDFIW